MRSRTVALTLLGTCAGLLVALLVITPLVLWVRSAYDYPEFPQGPILWFLVVIALWLAYLGGRFGHRVATYQDPEAVPPLVEDRTWSGAGWRLVIRPGTVEVTTSRGTKTYTGADARGAFLVRTGQSWQLELPDDSIHVLHGLGPEQADEIRQACRGISAG